MNKILLDCTTITILVSLIIFFIKLLLVEIKISKIIILSVLTTPLFVFTTAKQLSGVILYTEAFMVIYIISQFTVILYALHSIKDNETECI